MAEVAFRPVRQLSEYKGKGASASRETFAMKMLAKVTAILAPMAVPCVCR